MVITVGHIKGGVGKSTIAVNLAVMLAATGADVLFLDADNQGSASKFTDAREEKQGNIPYTFAQVRGERVRDALSKFKPKFDHIVVDVGGRDGIGFRAALLRSTMLLTPSQPGQFDCWEMSSTAELATEMKVANPDLKCLLVLSRVHPDARVKDTAEALELAREIPDFRVLDTFITNRVSYSRSVSDGLSVTEMSKDKDEKAITEMQNLLKELINESAENS